MSEQKSSPLLIVDDEPAILLSVRFVLEQAGFAVTQAENGAQALAAARETPPRIAVLDVMMPGMNGFELAEELRKLPDLADVRIVFLTARGTPRDKADGYRSGGEVYLTKPFDNDELVRTVRELAEFG